MHDELPSREQIQALGVRSHVDSAEKFFSGVREAHARAEIILAHPEGVAPQPETLCSVHRAIFGGVLASAGAFREGGSPEQTVMPSGKIYTGDAVPRILAAVKRLAGLLSEKSPKKQVAMIADQHMSLMAIGAFPEIPGSDYVNRTVALAVLEAQLQHCFGNFPKREVDLRAYTEALGSAVGQTQAGKALHAIVRDLAGSAFKVVHLAKWQHGGPSHGHNP